MSENRHTTTDPHHDDTGVVSVQQPGADETDHRETLTWAQIRRPLAVMLAVALALGLAFLAGRWTSERRTPSASSVDVGFARDMTAHHAQAVDMSLSMLSKKPSGDIRTLAYDVARTQENQRGQMMGWLADWGAPLAVTGPRMQWMARTGHHHDGLKPGQMLLSDGRMPGMASSSQLAELDSATGKGAEVLYLRLMIVHHRAGVQMAEAAEGAAGNPQVVRLAKTMVAGQQSEIDLMTQLLSKRGAKPWTNVEAGQR